MLRDIEAGHPQVQVVAEIIKVVRPDILFLTDFDWDYRSLAVQAFNGLLATDGLTYPYFYAAQPNSGLQSGLDLDGDGRLNEPEDAQGFGKFPGAEGMVLLSRFQILEAQIRNYSNMLWKDLPGARMPPALKGASGPTEIGEAQRLSYKGHWVVPVKLANGGVLNILASHATPPVFDGPDNLNGLRNRDEIRFWSLLIGGDLAQNVSQPFVIVGDLNADPHDGEGEHDAVSALLSHPLVNDVKPASKGAVAASVRQGKGNAEQNGDPTQDTVDWDESRTPGNMRVDYVLPSSDLRILDAGVFWPAPTETGFDLVGSDGGVGSHHRLVWVEFDTNR